MQLKPADLDGAVARGILSETQAQDLLAYLKEQGRDTPGFNVTHILYYLGGMIAIGAMTLFMNLGWEIYGGWFIFSVSMFYGAAALGLAHYLLYNKNLAIPAGILLTLAIVMVPLAVYGLELALGWWVQSDTRHYRDYHRYIDWNWLLMELATLAAAAVALWRYRLPFGVMPVAVTLWYMSMDLAPFLAGGEMPEWELRKHVSLWFGLAMVLFAFLVDLRSRHDKDYAFWLYLFGCLAFWGGLSLMDSNSELGKFIYLCINLGLIAVGATLSRRIFAVCGGLGAAFYLGHLADTIFRNSLLFPFALTGIGLGVVYCGVLWQRHEGEISARLRAGLPREVRELIERRA